MTDILIFELDTLLLLGTLILAGLVVWQYLKRRGDRETTARDWDIAGKATTFWERLKDRVMRMSKYAVAFTALVMFFLVPGGDNKLQYLVGVIFGLLLFGYILPRLMAYNTFYAVDLEQEEIAVFDICNLMLPFYRFVDREGAPASLEYSLWDRRGRAWIVDWVDLENRVIMVNPITMSMEFAKEYRKAYDTAVSDANEYFNNWNEAKTQLEQKVDKRAVEMLEQIGAWKREVPMPDIRREDEADGG